MKKLLFSIGLALLTSSCASYQTARQEQRYYAQASTLTKLSAAVEVTVRYKNPSPLLRDDELVKLAATENPALLTSLAEYAIRVRRDEGHAVLLVCDTKGHEAIFEDAGCTAKLDLHHWKERPRRACEFTLTAQAVCTP